MNLYRITVTDSEGNHRGTFGRNAESAGEAFREPFRIPGRMVDASGDYSAVPLPDGWRASTGDEQECTADILTGDAAFDQRMNRFLNREGPRHE